MRLPRTDVAGDLRPDKSLELLAAETGGLSSSDGNGKSPWRKRPRRRHDRSVSPSSRQYATDTTSGGASSGGNVASMVEGVSAQAAPSESTTSSSSSPSKGWHIAERIVAHMAKSSSVGSRRPPRVPSPMTSPTMAGRGGSSSSSHGAADDSGMSSAGGGSSSGKSRSSRRSNGRSSSQRSSRQSSSCSSSANGLNASVSESSLTTMRDGESSTLCGMSASPLTLADWSTVVDQTLCGQPGAVGIANHTNSCFINAVVQCLGHTAPLVAELLIRMDRKHASFHHHPGNRWVDVRAGSPMFLTDSGGEEASFDSFSRRRNTSDVVGTGRILGRRGRPEHARAEATPGTKLVSRTDSCGSSSSITQRDDHVTRALSNLVSGLWTGRYSMSVSSSFCQTVRHLAPDLYNTSEQHDAHEFLVWLLDCLNDDLKVNTLRRSDGGHVTTTTSKGGATAPSIVQNLFAATCRSTLVCPGCLHHSETLEPYMSVSLPISTPRPRQRPAAYNTKQHAVYVTVVRTRSVQDAQGVIRPKRYGWEADPNAATVQHLKEALTRRCHVPDSQLVLAEVRGCGFHVTLHNFQMVSELRRAHNIYAFETLPPTAISDMSRAQAGGQSDRSILSEQTISVIVLSIDSKYARRLSQPFVVRLKRNVTYMDLKSSLLKEITDESTCELLNTTYKQNGNSDGAKSLFRIRLLDGLTDVSPYLEPGDSMLPFCTQTVQQALNNCTDGYGPQHIKLVLEWDYKARLSAGLHTSSSSDIDDDVTYSRLKQKEQKIQSAPVAVSLKLADCLKAFTQQERLDDENCWQCSNCLQTQRGAMKRLTFSSLPDVLVIHLKRFKQVNNSSRVKLDTLVQFPVMDSLDLGKFVDLAEGRGTDCRDSGEYNATEPSNHAYHLYAVCNHIGDSLQSGHYTAFCRSPLSGEWNSYDDQHVASLKQEDIVTKDAYILFYERRTTMQCNDAVTRIVTWMNGARQRTVEMSRTPRDSPNVSFDSRSARPGSDVSKSTKNSTRHHQNRSRSLPLHSHRASSRSPIFLNSSVCSSRNAEVISAVKNKPLGNSEFNRNPPITNNDMVTEEFKERSKPSGPLTESDAMANGPTALPKSVRNPPSCLKKTQKPSPSKFPLWNAFFSSKSHVSRTRSSSATGHYPEDSKHGRRNSVSSTLPRSRNGRLFRSTSAGRVNDSTMTDGVIHGSSETIHRRVRWDPSSESPKEKKQSAIPAWKPRVHMVVQESSV